MCEILVVRPGSIKDKVTSFVASGPKQLYQQNNDGLGLVGVYPDEEAGEFNYAVAKAEQPDWNQVTDWFEQHLDAWRIIIHARLATAGGTGIEQTHPIKVVDDDVDANWVVHNGVVTGARHARNRLKDDGHEFHTAVDSEVIAHRNPDLPDDVSDGFDEGSLYGRLNYLLLGDEKILIRSDGKYNVSDAFLMTCRGDWLDDDYDDVGKGVALIRPDKSVQTGDIESSGWYSSRSSSRSTNTYRQSGLWDTSRSSRGTLSHHNNSTDDDTDDDDDDDDDATGHSYASPGPIARVIFDPAAVGTNMWDRRESGNGYTLTVAETSIRDGDKLVFDVTDRTGAPIQGALVAVDVGGHNDDDAYDHTGSYTTGRWGEVTVPAPDDNTIVVGRLAAVNPAESDAITTDDDDDMVISDDGTTEVNWWHHYEQHRNNATGMEEYVFCSMHNSEQRGLRCEECLNVFDTETLLQSQNEALNHIERDLKESTADD